MLRGELSARYLNVTFNETGRQLHGEDLLHFLAGHEKAITALETIDAPLLSRLPELQVISKYGVGIDMIDIDAMRRYGKRLGWKGGVNRRSVSELTLAFAISLLHQVPSASALVRGGGWRQVVGVQLTEKTVGIVGCGHVGKDLVTLLTPFRCRILVYDIANYPDFFREHGVEAVSLNVLLEQSDVVTLHVPLDDSTRGMLSAERLSVMKPTAVLINAARGGLVDEVALARMLREGRLGGAAFDVFQCEPPADNSLTELSNFLCTPHIGGSAAEAILAMGRAAIMGLDENAVP